MEHPVGLDRCIARTPHVPGRAERRVETSGDRQVIRGRPGSGLYPIQDTCRRAGFQVYLLVAWGVRREADNSEPRPRSSLGDCSPNRPMSCLVNRSPDCSRNRFPGCFPGCSPSRCPRCSLHRSTRCSTGRSDHCGLSRRPRCSPRSSDHCCPGCSANSLPNCSPSRSVHCSPGCRASNVPGQMFEGTSQRPNPQHSVRLIPAGAGFTAGRAEGLAALLGQQHLADGLGLSLSLCLAHEVHAGREPADVIGAAMQANHLPAADVEEDGFGDCPRTGTVPVQEQHAADDGRGTPSFCPRPGPTRIRFLLTTAGGGCLLGLHAVGRAGRRGFLFRATQASVSPRASITVLCGVNGWSGKSCLSAGAASY